MRGISLHEALSRACFLELGREPCKLRQVLVDEADLRGEAVFVYVLGEVTSDVAWERVVSLSRHSYMWGGGKGPPSRVTYPGRLLSGRRASLLSTWLRAHTLRVLCFQRKGLS